MARAHRFRTTAQRALNEATHGHALSTDVLCTDDCQWTIYGGSPVGAGARARAPPAGASCFLCICQRARLCAPNCFSDPARDAQMLGKSFKCCASRTCARGAFSRAARGGWAPAGNTRLGARTFAAAVEAALAPRGEPLLERGHVKLEHGHGAPRRRRAGGGGGGARRGRAAGVAFAYSNTCDARAFIVVLVLRLQTARARLGAALGAVGV